VHRAALRDGRKVAVKVQRPGVAAQVASDLDALEEVARFLDRHSDTARGYDVVGTVAEFREAVTAELDYLRESSHLRLIGRNLDEFEKIVVPQPIDDYTTTRVLTMDYVPGLKVTAISPVARVDLAGEELSATLIRAYLKQIIIDGVFHADPHPGNVFVTDDGRLALLDLGMVGRLSPGMQERLLKLLLAVSDGRGEEAADVAVTIGERRAESDEPAFRRDITALVSRFSHQSAIDFQIGRVFIQLAQVFHQNHMRPPSDLTMLGKTLLNLDEVARSLNPRFDVNQAIRDNGAEMMQRRMRKAVTSTGLFSAVLEAKEFAEKLPGRVNRVLDSLAASELKLKVEVIDEGSIIGGLQKVANRITLGLILASLVVGAAMMMQIDTPFRILGYPGVAMILFLLAGAGAAYLAVQILLHDRRPGG
jgi:ubiquinone biosynthesis protein